MVPWTSLGCLHVNTDAVYLSNGTTQFTHEKRYGHFTRLVMLLNIRLQFEISTEEIETLREGFLQHLQQQAKGYPRRHHLYRSVEC